MPRYAGLILKNIVRNKLRTTLSCAAIVVLICICCLLWSVLRVVKNISGDHASNARLVVREKWSQPSRFPVRYVSEISRIAGVRDWTIWHYYCGHVDDCGHQALGFATRIDNFTSMHPGLEELDPALLESFQREKTGALVGGRLMEQMGWRVGQQFRVRSFVQKRGELEFRIVGVLDQSPWEHIFFFRDDYYRENVPDPNDINILWLSVADAKTANRVAAQVERLYANSEVQLRVETESGGASRLAETTQNICHMLYFLVAIVVSNIVVILGNSVSVIVRQRRREMAILKAIGFPPSTIMALIAGETVLLGAISGTVGATLAWILSRLNASGCLWPKIGILTLFPVPLILVVYGLLIGAAVGFLSSLLPAWSIRRLRVTEVFADPDAAM